MTISEVRSFFPHLSKDEIYFNHASTAPVSLMVKKAIDDYLDKTSSGGIDDYESVLQKIAETRKLLASMINASDTDIAFCDNTSNGLNILAQGLKLKRGDRILLNDVEFPANVYPFLNLRSKGIIVDFVKSRDKCVSAADIIEAVKPETKLISVSQVQFLSGYRVDLKKIGEFCSRNDIVFSVDAIQGIGAVNLDVKKSYIDFISCGTQKWLLGCAGLAFIYASEKLRNMLQPAYAGWLSVRDAWNLLDFNLTFRNSAKKFETGTLNFMGIHALLESLNLFNHFGFENIERRIISNTSYFTGELEKIGYSPLAGKYDKEFYSGIVTFPHPEADKINDELRKKKIFFSVREGMLRFSPHFYNNSEDIDKVVEQLKHF